MIKLALLSNERFDRGVNWTTLSDSLFSELEQISDCARLAPPRRLAAQLRALPHLVRAARRCDAVFSMNGRIRPQLVFASMSMCARRSLRAVFYVDPWKHLLDKLRSTDRWMQHDIAFIPYREAFDELVSGPGGSRYRYLPFGADTRIFRDHGLVKDIDILWMGRRDDPLHQAILDYAGRSGLTYRYRENTGFLADPKELGQLVSRARYFVTTPPDPARSGGFSPLVMRYLEGLAAGCRLVGTLPRSGEFESFLPLDSLLQVSPDGCDFAQRFEQDQNNKAGWEATLTASKLVHQKHGWDSRAREIMSEIEQMLPSR